MATAQAGLPNTAADAAFATVGTQFLRAPPGQHCFDFCAAAGKKSASFGSHKALPTHSLCAANPDGTGMFLSLKLLVREVFLRPGGQVADYATSSEPEAMIKHKPELQWLLRPLCVCAGFKAGWIDPKGPPVCTIWHLNQLLAVPTFACMCLDASELITLTTHAAVDTTCEDTCAAGELASGFGVKTDLTHGLYACVPQSDVSSGNR